MGRDFGLCFLFLSQIMHQFFMEINGSTMNYLWALYKLDVTQPFFCLVSFYGWNFYNNYYLV